MRLWHLRILQSSRRLRARAEAAEGRAALRRYEDTMRTLLVGEGNFSFARALVRLFDGNGFGLTATAYDSREVCLQKYHDAADILQEVRGAVSIPVVTRARL
jgi:25S rRNA (uracil2634-N3)-methyltransferase